MKPAKRHEPSHYEQSLSDPAAFYASPNAILEDRSLTKAEKLTLLKQWEYDTREMMVAEEENMTSGEDASATFDLIVKAIRKLEPSYRAIQSSGTKQGGG